MATYIADSGSSDRFAQLTGTFTTDEVDKTTHFGGDGQADTGFTLPDDGSEWMLVEVFDVEDVAGDVGYTLFKSQVRNLAADMATAQGVADTEYTLYNITCTHYYGDDTADVYRGDEVISLTLAGGDTGISYTPSAVSWKITDTPIAPDAGQTYNTAIVIDNTKVAGSTALTNFPVSLTEDNFTTNADSMFDNCRSDGGDLRFYSDVNGTTQIPHEIASIDTGATNEIEVYVKVPSVSTSADTTIYVRYGDTSLTMQAVDATYGRNAVWADYDRVFHFNDLPSTDGGLTDATGNSTIANNFTHGTWADGDKVAGGFKSAWSFSGTNGIEIQNLDVVKNAVSTISFAVEYGALDASVNYIMTQSRDADATAEWRIGTYANKPYIMLAGNTDIGVGTAMSADEYYTGSIRIQYTSDWDINGAYDTVADDNDHNRLSGTGTSGDNILIGSRWTAAPAFETGNCWAGTMSEIRIISGTDKGADWCTTERENLYNVDTFAEASTPTAL